MNLSNILKVVILLELVLVLAMLHNNTSKPNHVTSFRLSPEEIAKDMDGRVVQLPYGQVWPFDPTQFLSVKVIAKKQLEENVIVLVDVRAVADVKETTKDTKEVTKDTKEKLPIKVKLSGYAKLTYENIGIHWNLVNIEAISGKDGLRVSNAD